MLQRGNSFTGQRVLQDRVLSHPKVEVRWNTSVDAVLGEGQVEGVSVTELTSGETSRIDLSGVFIFVGLEPNSQYLADLLTLDNAGHVPTDIWMRTPLPGLLAAGDIRQSSAAQLVTSAGDGATAAIAAQRYVETGEWPGLRGPSQPHVAIKCRRRLQSAEVERKQERCRGGGGLRSLRWRWMVAVVISTGKSGRGTPWRSTQKRAYSPRLRSIRVA